MIYAKVKNNQVLEFPFTWEIFLTENSSTLFDSRFDLVGWYAQTEAASDGSSIVEVVLASIPTDIDWQTQTADRAEIPTFSEGIWKLTWVIRPKTSTELAVTDNVVSVIE